ncbi:MAG TPA: SulP family inorganic anion transporter [Cyclobacteriaceae bacterium]|nr:SulP family inorganic anion transporter [Cyclobacteriaceae bacterium]
MKHNQFTPKLFSVLREGITREQFFKDLVAGLIVGVVALPLAIAFAIASGVSPDKGLITAVIAGAIISIFGGSRVQIGGPTGAFIVIVYAIVQEHGVAGLTIATFMAGFLIIAMGLARMGNLLKYIPYPLIVGFTSGIAVIIFSSQIKDFFGLPLESVPADFLAKWSTIFGALNQINWTAFIIAFSTVLIGLYFHKVTNKVPGSLVAILLSTFVVSVFDLPVATIGSVYGEIPRGLPAPTIPSISYETIKKLIEPAVAIALLGGIESLLSAVVADGMTGSRHRSNAELVAQGAANVMSALFGGIPATGAIARTATNVRNGGRTPLAGLFHCVVLLLIMISLGPYAGLIPMACLAGILVVVAYHMSEWQNFVSLLKGNKMDVAVLLVTFFLTVLVDLVVAIEIGMILSGFAFMKRMSDSVSVERLEIGADENGDELFEEELAAIPKGVALYEIRGALFFGAAQQFQDTIRNIDQKPKILIIRLRSVPFIDATGIYRLKEIIRHFNQRNVVTLLSGVNESIKNDLEKADIYSVTAPENILSHIDLALERARVLLAREEGESR